MWVPRPALSHPLGWLFYQIYRCKPWDAVSSSPAHLQMVQMNPPNSPSINVSKHHLLRVQRSSRHKGGCRKEIESLVLTLQGHCHGNRKGVVERWKRAQFQWEARAQLGCLPHFVCTGCSCLLCSLWMKPPIVVSGAVSQKCVMRKRQDVNVLSRKKQFHGQMSWDTRVKEKQTGLFLRKISGHFLSWGAAWISTRALKLAAFPKLAWTQRRTSSGSSI